MSKKLDSNEKSQFNSKSNKKMQNDCFVLSSESRGQNNVDAKPKNQSSNWQIKNEDELIGNSSLISNSLIFLPNDDQNRKNADVSDFSETKMKEVSSQVFLSSLNFGLEPRTSVPKDKLLKAFCSASPYLGNPLMNSIQRTDSSEILRGNFNNYPNYASQIIYPSQSCYQGQILKSNVIQNASNQVVNYPVYFPYQNAYGNSGIINCPFPYVMAVPSIRSNYLLSSSSTRNDDSVMLRLTNNRTYKISRISANILENLEKEFNGSPIQFICSEKGSIELTKLLFEPNLSTILFCYLFHRIIFPNLEYLLKNLHGSNIVTINFQLCNEEERGLIWEKIKNKLVELCTNRVSCKCIHILLDKALKVTEQIEIVKCFQPHLSDISQHKIGSQILKKIILNFTWSTLTVLLKYIYENFNKLVYDSQGINLIKTYIQYLTREHITSDIRESYIVCLFNEIPKILQSKNGYFAILSMMELWKYEEYKPIIQLLSKNFIHYALNAYSSKILLRIFDSNIVPMIRGVLYDLSLNQEDLISLIVSNEGYNVLAALIPYLTKIIYDICQILNHLMERSDMTAYKDKVKVLLNLVYKRINNLKKMKSSAISRL